MNHVVAVDIAKKSDYTAIMVTQRGEDGYDIIFLSKLQGLSYPDVARTINRVMVHPRLSRAADLLVDSTGVGEAVIDLLRDQGLNPVSILFTGGKQTQEVSIPRFSGFARSVREYHVPKQELVTAGAVLLQQGKIRMVPSLECAGEFRQQMSAFTGKASKRGIRYEAEDEFIHDDLVVCYLMTAWWILRKVEPQPAARAELPGDWNPYDFV